MAGNIGGAISAPRSKRFYTDTISLGTADTQTSYQFPLSMKSFVLHARNGNELRMATTSGKVAGSVDPYFTLKSNTSYDNGDLNLSAAQTVYFSCSVDNEVIEIIIGV